jgi:muramoyltetrapeptide carboxypeptidase
MFRKICLAILATSLFFVSQPLASAQQLTQPALLKPGDTIMFVAPAADLDRTRMMLAKKRLEERGYKIKMRDDLFAAEGYLAGSDQRRADELMQAFCDPEVDAVFPGTGGYGVTRMLDLLDYEVIRQNPKMLIGFSDITALHAALNKKSGLITYHSPVPMYGLGSDKNFSKFSKKYFFRAVEDGPEAGKDYTIECPKKDKVPQPIALGKGKARGRLTGGNLTLIAALEGTPYSLDMDGAILLIEDVGEAPYRVDRMLQQLKSAGKLTKIRGAVVGQFTESERVPSKPDQYVAIATKYGEWFWRNCQRLFIKVPEPKEEEPTDPRFTVEGVLHQYFDPLGVPVLMNFPIGHYKMNCTLPLGGEVEIDADAATLKVIARSSGSSANAPAVCSK